MTDQRRKLKELLIERLKFEDMTPDDIPDEEPLFGGGLGLDSIDALEIVVMLESEFGIKVKNESSARDHFQSIASLSGFIEERLARQQQRDGGATIGDDGMTGSSHAGQNFDSDDRDL